MFDNIILIPYRNREAHLDYFIKNTIPLFREHLPNSKVVVIEQTGGKLFNRGKILNVGFKEYENKSNYFFTHDVDINPTAICIDNFYSMNCKSDEIIAIYSSECNTLGGIIKCNNETIFKINGFPNDIWGWGTEDKALQNRSEFFNISKIKCLTTDKEHPTYILRFNDVDDRKKSPAFNSNTYFQYNLFKNLNSNKKEELIFATGLNNIEYKIISRKTINDMVELIKVEI